nr:ATP-binding protein [Orientia tsutsugamushi]
MEVQDTGNGFSLDLINYITEPYVTTRLRGSGLGLSIVKKIVEDHFGTLQIRNLPNGGAAVQIIFDNLKLQACLNRSYE